MSPTSHNLMVGITGASGSIYGLGLISVLHQLGHSCHICLSDHGAAVLKYECGYLPEDLSAFGKLYEDKDLFAGPASGTFPLDAMVIMPCSMNTLGKISVGISDTLITRAAGVMLKERKPLILVPREMPYSLPHLESMQTLTRAGAVILPASPGFYTYPNTISDLIVQVIAKTLDQLHIPGFSNTRWQSGGIILDS